MNNREELSSFLKEFAEYLTGFSEKDPATYFNNFDAERRYNGCDWPKNGLTMIGIQRLQNLQKLLLDVVDNNVPGDFIETGVWRGGACIFAATIFNLLKVNDRQVWVCDSFEGLPKPDPRFRADDNDIHHTYSELRVSLEEVKDNFAKFNLLNDNIRFIKGWFSDTLPNLQNEQFAVIRLDGDMYSSTIDALNNLYPALSPGGYVIIDDWGLVGAKQAVNDYRAEHNINDTIILIEKQGYSCYWQKT